MPSRAARPPCADHSPCHAAIGHVSMASAYHAVKRPSGAPARPGCACMPCCQHWAEGIPPHPIFCYTDTHQPWNGRASARLTARSGGLPIEVKRYSMCGHRASHTALLPSLLLLLVAVVSVDAQSRKPGRQEQRGVNVVPAVPTPPTAERRTALVIGNSSYTERPLANPVNDATDIAHALQQMGFAVTPLPGVVGLFYFAGHGLQVKGENYLVPIGARIAIDVQVCFRNLRSLLECEIALFAVKSKKI